jgi:Ca2+-binding EF-hand superfamily protein
LRNSTHAGLVSVITLLLPALPAWPVPASAQSGGDYFSVVDTDRDGRISLDEYIERFSWAFVQMDANRDGVLDPAEQLVPGGARITLAEHRARLSAQFRKQDADHDGNLSRREFLAPPAR